MLVQPKEKTKYSGTSVLIQDSFWEVGPKQQVSSRPYNPLPCDLLFKPGGVASHKAANASKFLPWAQYCILCSTLFILITSPTLSFLIYYSVTTVKQLVAFSKSIPSNGSPFYISIIISISNQILAKHKTRRQTLIPRLCIVAHLTSNLTANYLSTSLAKVICPHSSSLLMKSK